MEIIQLRTFSAGMNPPARTEDHCGTNQLKQNWKIVNERISLSTKMYSEVEIEEGWARQLVVRWKKLYPKKHDFHQLYTFESSLLISDSFCWNVINTWGSKIQWDGSPIHYSARIKVLLKEFIRAAPFFPGRRVAVRREMWENEIKCRALRDSIWNNHDCPVTEWVLSDVKYEGNFIDRQESW